jgi:hypothetical protein
VERGEEHSERDLAASADPQIGGVNVAGRQKGRPTKWVSAAVQESIAVGKPGVEFEVWDKWKKKRRKLGTLTVSVGGLRWWPHKAPKYRQVSWDRFAAWFNES